MAREHLQVDHGDDGNEQLVRHMGNPQDMLHERGDGLVAVRGNRHAHGAARDDLLDVGDRLIVDAVLGDDGDHGEAGLEQGYGPVLHLAGGIGLGVEVADLLELERALEGRRRVDATTEEEGGVRTAEELRDRLLDAYGEQGWWSDDPYTVIFQSVLVQNTAWTIVERVSGSIDPLTPGWVSSVSQAELEDAIKPCGMSRSKAATIKALTRWFEGFGFDAAATEGIPDDVLRRDLMSVRGIGAETADVIMLYSFHRPVFVVDAYARRLLDRLGYRFESDREIKDFFETGLSHDAMLLGRCHRLRW